MPDVGRFFNIDPLAQKYTYNSPYAFSENCVVNSRELEGLEKVLAIFYHGGYDGDGKIRPQATKNEGYTATLYNKAMAHYRENGEKPVGAIISPSATQGKGVKTGTDFVEKNYEKGDKVVIYGYSYGGDNAVNLAENLQDKNIPVERMVLVDSSDGPLLNTTVDMSIPNNVKSTLNIYQRDPSGNSGNPSDKNDNSDSGTGARGEPATAEGKNKGKM